MVIGEGEKDNAPMLFNGERVGTGPGPQVDIAVDPIDGTSLTAAGRMSAISVIAVSDIGTLLDASAVFRMDKFVVGQPGVGVCDIGMSVGENRRAHCQWWPWILEPEPHPRTLIRTGLSAHKIRFSLHSGFGMEMEQ